MEREYSPEGLMLAAWYCNRHFTVRVMRGSMFTMTLAKA
jgi:hypothetical protein